RTFFHGHTYGGNPLAASVALASLDIFEEERVLERLAPKIARLGQQLDRIRSLPTVGDVRQCGLIGAVELVRNQETKEPFPWEERRGIRVCEFAMEQGVWLRPLGNVIIIFPPLCISLEQLDRICDTIAAGITATARHPS
ncbi:MAG TPA: aminotransferase class III-fold pyridoxal phosphate-dependent enzyme, partial [Pirellulaceae bacterium]